MSKRTKEQARPADRVSSTNGFEVAKEKVQFDKTCAEISERIFREGAWSVLERRQ